MIPIVVRRRELEEWDYKPDLIEKILGPEELEVTVQAKRTMGLTWVFDLPNGRYQLDGDLGHEIVQISIPRDELRKDPNFPETHPIWNLPIVYSENVTALFAPGSKEAQNPPELLATAIRFYQYYRVYIPNSLTCFIRQDQAHLYDR